MIFSDFAKILYHHCGDGKNRTDFIDTLTNKIVDGRPGASNADGQRINPMMDKGPRAKQKYFRGDLPFPDSVASVIRGRISPYKFEEYIREFSDGAQNNIANDLKAKGVHSVNKMNVPEKCAEIFQAILLYDKYEE